MELSLFVSPPGQYGDITGDTYAYKQVADATCVTFNVTRGVLEEEDAKLSTLFASGKLPNLIGMYNTTWANKLGPDGLFVPLDTYLNAGKMPNFKAMLEKRGIPVKDITASDGHIYNATEVTELSYPPALLMRADLLQACGIIKDKNNPGPPNVIGTIDELMAAFTCFQTQLGGKPVLGARGGPVSFLPRWARWFGTSTNQYFNPATKKYEYGPLMDRYRVFLQFFADLHAKGMLVPDYATQTSDDLKAMRDAGTLGAMLENPGLSWGINSPTAFEPGRDFFAGSLTINGERVLWPRDTQLYDTWNALVISAKSSQEQIDAAVHVIDFLYSDKGAEVGNYGVEGVDWKVGSDGFVCLMGTYKAFEAPASYCDGKVPETAPSYQTLGLLDGNQLSRQYAYGFLDKFALVQSAAYWPTRYADVNKQLEDTGSWTDPLPHLNLTKDEQDVVTQVGNPLDTYVLEETQKFIEGKRPLTDAEWDAFKSQVTQLGAQQVVDVYAAALARD